MKAREIVTDAITGETCEQWIDLPDLLTADQAESAALLLQAQQAREDRDQRLAACDWTMLADAPLTDTQRAAWVTYRQALRDVTEQARFPAIFDWPTTPL